MKEELNRTVLGWAAYFSYGTWSRAYRAVDCYVAERVRHFWGGGSYPIARDEALPRGAHLRGAGRGSAAAP